MSSAVHVLGSICQGQRRVPKNTIAKNWVPWAVDDVSDKRKSRDSSSKVSMLLGGDIFVLGWCECYDDCLSLNWCSNTQLIRSYCSHRHIEVGYWYIVCDDTRVWTYDTIFDTMLPLTTGSMDERTTPTAGLSIHNGSRRIQIHITSPLIINIHVTIIKCHPLSAQTAMGSMLQLFRAVVLALVLLSGGKE